jgi:hypothetical protein
MPHRNRLPRLLLVISLLIGLCAGIFAPRLDQRAEARPNYSGTMEIIINEIAWSGTQANVNAEWIELYNPNNYTVNLSGWTLRAIDGTPNITLTGTIPAQGYYLLERTADTTISDIPADQIYTGALANTPAENLELRDAGNNLIDTANEGSTTWLAGTAGPNFYSMERKGLIPDGPSAWASNNGVIINGTDAGGNPIRGTPKQQNSAFNLYFPLSVLINEVAWAGTIASSDDEWIELYNPGPADIDLTGWRLVADDGSPDITLSGTIPANEYYLLERGSDNVVQGITANLIYTGALSDSGEILRLRAPNGTIVDTANSSGGAWHAGNASTRSSMERVGVVADNNLAWTTFEGIGTALDAGGNPINGTPGNPNAMFGIPPTFTPSPTLTPTRTPTNTATITPTPSGLRSVIINEIAWAGTGSGLSNDEWIELYNPGADPINITGWKITAADGTPNITLNGTIPAGGYFLLERGANLSDDATVSDIPADQIYTGNALTNTGEALFLYDPSGKVIDSANGNGGPWPAGSSSTYGTMERIAGTADSDSAWHTNTGTKRNGKNRNGGDILGTPKQSNSIGPTPTPNAITTATRTPTPTVSPFPPSINARLIINEILVRPGFDWNRDGRADAYDEFIEIKNLSPINVDLSGWRLDDQAVGGVNPFSLPNITLKPGEHAVFYRTQTNIPLSDGGGTVRLLNPRGLVYDEFSYIIAKQANRSFCRIPDGSFSALSWQEDCIPTPNLPNTREGSPPTTPGSGFDLPNCGLPDTIPADFLSAECRGYGSGIWNPYYWDKHGWPERKFLPHNDDKWESFIE